jgi:hypothetical protein
LVTLCAFLQACRFDGNLGPGTKVRCEDNSDCPRGSRCISFGVCAEPDSIFSAKEIVPNPVGRQRPVRIVLEFVNARPAAPTVSALTPQTQESAMLKLNQEGKRFEYEYLTPANLESDVIFFVADGTTATQRVVELGSVDVDKTPPVLEVIARQLTPPTAELLGTRIRQLTRVTHQTEVEVVVQNNEKLAAPATLWILKGTARIPMTGVVVPGAFGATYRGNVGDVTGLSTVAVWGSAEDFQGNAMSAQLLELQVDTQAPSDPKVNEPEAIRFIRTPKGTLDKPNTPVFTLESVAAAIEPDSVVVVSSANGIISRLQTAADGSLPRSELPLKDDLPTVLLQVADEAGNVSKLVQVRDVDIRTYTDASQVFMAPGQSYESHFFFSTRPARPSVVLSPDKVVEAMPLIIPIRELVTSWPLRPSTLQGTFIFQDEPCDPQTNRPVGVNWWADAFYGEGLQACDPERGGWWSRSLKTNTVDLTGAQRVDLAPTQTFLVGSFGSGVEDAPNQSASHTFTDAGADVARRNTVAVMDFARDRVVIFGGEGLDGGVLGDTWEMPYRGKLEQVLPMGSTPPPRKHAAMAYHPTFGKVVLHGGSDGRRTLNDTWTWNGTVWERIPQSQPLAREQHDIIYGVGRGTLLMSGGLSNGDASVPMMMLAGMEWRNDRLVDVQPPSACDPNGYSMAVVSNRGVEAFCPASVPDAGSRYSLYAADGGQLVTPYAPFAGAGPNFRFGTRLDITRRFGLAAYDSDNHRAPGLIVLSNGDWAPAKNASGKTFAGACFVWNGEFACNDGRTVTLSNNAEASLPSTSRAIVSAHVWPQSEGVYVVARTTDDGSTARYVVDAMGRLTELQGPFHPVAQVVYAGAPEGELFVLLRSADGSDFVFTEVFDGAKWVARDLSTGANFVAMTQAARMRSGRHFAFDIGALFGRIDTMNGVSPYRFEVVAKGLQPTFQAILPDVPLACDQLKSVDIEALAEGMAGGVPGVDIHLWNGLDFTKTPTIQSQPSVSRPKATFLSPGPAFRFGMTLSGVITDVNDFETQVSRVRFSTLGKTKGALDGKLTVTAFETRYACRYAAK